MSSARTDQPSDDALEAVPLFPLQTALLLPQTVVSLHVFEPRYRALISDIVDGDRVLAIPLLDEAGDFGEPGLPPLHRYAGLGVLRRVARLPDGRFNVLVEGLCRVELIEEESREPERPYRRAKVRRLADRTSDDPTSLQDAATALRALCSHVVTQLSEADDELLGRLNDLEEPGVLADTVAAATVSDPQDRRRILSELDVSQRLEIASGALGTLFLRSRAMSEDESGGGTGGWGIGPGRA